MDSSSSSEDGFVEEFFAVMPTIGVVPDSCDFPEGKGKWGGYSARVDSTNCAYWVNLTLTDDGEPKLNTENVHVSPQTI